MSRAVLVISPAPVFPTSAGNRRRILTVCETLRARGYEVDFALFGHEDEIYRAFGHHAPTDMKRMAEFFRNVFYIEPEDEIRIRTKSHAFLLDDWYSPQLDLFVDWYFRTYPATVAVFVNYVFLSSALTRAPKHVVRVIDAHDRFADRRLMYAAYRGEPNFFYLDRAAEADGLARADFVLAIQETEKAYFSSIAKAPVHLIMHRVERIRPPTRRLNAVRAIGFIGHGNDANVVSISQFAAAWSARRRHLGGPNLVIAGEICSIFAGGAPPGVQLLGYCDSLDDFYDAVDIVVTPLVMGTGLKIKTVEALAYGKPVVGTRLAFEGLDPVHEAHCCESSDAVVSAVASIAASGAAGDALCRASAELFDHYLEATKRGEDAFFRDFENRLDAAAANVVAEDVRPPADRDESTPAWVERFDSGALVWRETSVDSLPSEARRTLKFKSAPPRAAQGRLLATERRIATPRDDARAAARAFSPFRHRWFLADCESAAAETATGALECDDSLRADDFGPRDAPAAIESSALAALEDAQLAASDRDRLLAVTLGARPDWRASAWGLSVGRYLIALTTLAPPAVTRPGAVLWGTLTAAQGDDADASRPEHFRVEVTRVWLAEDAQCPGGAAWVRPGAKLTIVPVGLNFRLSRPIPRRPAELRLAFGRHIGVVSLPCIDFGPENGTS